MNPAQEHMEQCCKQLENMGEMCMCEGIKMMMNSGGARNNDYGGQLAIK
jgi:hypothetical protein